MLSIIIPLRNEIENLDSIKESFSESLGEIKYEVLFINDFSTDGTLQKACSDVFKQDGAPGAGIDGMRHKLCKLLEENVHSGALESALAEATGTPGEISRED